MQQLNFDTLAEEEMWHTKFFPTGISTLQDGNKTNKIPTDGCKGMCPFLQTTVYSNGPLQKVSYFHLQKDEIGRQGPEQQTVPQSFHPFLPELYYKRWKSVEI